MEILHNELKRCDVVKIKGRIDSSTAPKFAEEVNEIVEAGRFRIVMDMEELDFISSAGLRVLIGTQKTCKRYNRGEVVLANVPETIMASLELAGFTPLFKIFDTAVSAVGNF
ncbi:MAG: STAS domain-containing protein [Bellilinea sp.]